MDEPRVCIFADVADILVGLAADCLARRVLSAHRITADRLVARIGRHLPD